MKLILVTLIGLWSGFVIASEIDDGEYNFSRISDKSYLESKQTTYFVSINPKQTNVFEKNMITVDNMPAIRNLDGKGLCSSCGPAAVIQKMECDIKNIKDCSKIPDKDRINLLGLYAFNDYARSGVQAAKGGQYNAKDGPKQRKYSPRSALDFIGGDPYNILENVNNASFKLITDSCYPFDQFSNSVDFKHPSIKGLFNVTKSDAIFDTLEKQYNIARKKLIAETPTKLKTKDPNIANEMCDNCVAELQSQIYEIGKVQEEAKILRAIREESFPTFLYSALFGNCYDQLKQFPEPKKIVSFPEKPTELTYDQIINEITNSLKQQKPIIIDNLCTNVSKKDPDLCLGLHTTTIKGIKEVCEKNNPTKCRKYFQIHECYGQDWHDEYGEWFDAEELISNLVPKNADRVAINDGPAHPKFPKRTSKDQKILYDSNLLIRLDY